MMTPVTPDPPFHIQAHYTNCEQYLPLNATETLVMNISLPHKPMFEGIYNCFFRSNQASHEDFSIGFTRFLIN